MFKDRRLLLFFTLFSFLWMPNFSHGQKLDSLSIKDVSDITFEKVIVDGDIFYRNTSSNEFISPRKYMLFLESQTGGTVLDEDHADGEETNDYWLNDRVNPYRGVTLSVPFQLKFNQATFTHPVNGELVTTSRFGRRRRGPHRGLDLDLVTGDSVVSVLPGIVRFVGYSRGHGKTVVVRHANEVETVYAHLSGYSVKPNELISEGQLLGYGGNTGNSRGSHLHLEVRYKGVCVHPEYVFNFDGSQTIRGEELWVTNALQSPRFHSSYKKSKFTPFFTKAEAIAAQDDEPRYHRVRSGDTLSHIAGRYHLGVREICRLNRITPSTLLRIGQVLQVR
ncbi:MAG: peptidoglycan DD-metalloendopeptidase family protein [Bacteroidota bacterium]